MVILKSPAEIGKMRESNGIVAETLQRLKEIIKPGITTLELDIFADKFARSKGAKPAFKGYKGYPFALCTSVNSEVVHGFPSKTVLLQEGDIISLDFGVYYGGYYGDSAITVAVGGISPQAEHLMRTTEEALYLAIDNACAGNRLGDIANVVQSHVEQEGFSVVRDFVGHGIGRRLHEDPQVPNYGIRGRGMKLKAGLVLAIEPMVNAGTYEVVLLSDGWTVVTADHKLSAHFEHTVAITENGPEILSRII